MTSRANTTPPNSKQSRDQRERSLRLRKLLAGLLALFLLVISALVLIVRTAWFETFAREKIAAAVEDATGGKAAVGSFTLRLGRLEAVIGDLLIHGKEPASARPFVFVKRVQVNVRLLPNLHQFLDISFLGLEAPEVNVIMAADGSTNIPTPPDRKPASDKTALETVVDLAVDRFDLKNGSLTFNSARQPLNVSAEHLRALLLYSSLNQRYQGELSIQPVYVVSGRNTPVVFTLRVPLTIEKNRLAIENARISTATSDLSIRGSFSNPQDPSIAARLDGHLSIEDLRKLADAPPGSGSWPEPSRVDLSAQATVSGRSIQVESLRLTAGASEISASGSLKSPGNSGSLEVQARVVLDELGRLAGLATPPQGVVTVRGTARLDQNNNYTAEGIVAGRELSFVQGKQRIGPAQFDASVHADSHRMDAKDIRLAAYGGRFEGTFSLEELARYRLTGVLRNFDLQSLMSRLGQKAPYSGTISGPLEASGNLKTPGTRSLAARVRLDITPGRKGVPVSGKLYAEYDGAADNLDVDQSFVRLPHTRLTLSGSLNRRLDLNLTSRDLGDLFAAAGKGGQNPVALEGGEAVFTGTLTGALTSPRLSGHIGMTRFRVDSRRFDGMKADIAAARTGVSVSNGSLNRGEMQALFSASAGLRDWQPAPKQPLSARLSVRDGDLADLAALAGQPPEDYSGTANIEASIGGTLGNPSGSANLEIGKGEIAGETVDGVEARVQLSNQWITVPAASVVAGPARLTLQAAYQHPSDTFTSGRLHATVQGTNIDLARLKTVQKLRPNTAGSLNLNADLAGTLKEPQFVLESVNADASAKALRFDGENYGDFNAKARTAGQTVSYEVASNFAGSDLRVNGRTHLTGGYPTTADARLQNLPVERVLAVAKRGDLPVKGRLSGTAHLNGTIDKPEGTANLRLENAVLYEEKLDRLSARIDYLADRIEVSGLEAVAGPNRLDLSARYQHPPGALTSGTLDFRVASNPLEIGRFRNLQKYRPGLAGTLRVHASGSATVREGSPRLLFRSLDADVAASGLKVQGKDLGSATLKANTTRGTIRFALDADLADAVVQARGDAKLSGDYPVSGQLTFKNVAWTHIRQLLGTSVADPDQFEVLAEGGVTLDGPALKPDQLRGKLELTSLRLGAISRPGAKKQAVEVRNQGPIVATLDRGTVRLQSVRLAGSQTEITASGTASLTRSQALDLVLKGNLDLSLLQGIQPDLFASGRATLAATVKGTIPKPAVTGQLELQKASLNTVDLPSGISNANGIIVFSGSTATIRDLTAESGGGKITLGGYVGLEDKLRLGVTARAQNVRIRPQPGISVVASANLRLTGTSEASLASGNIVINGVTYAPQSDLGSLLTQSAPPVQAPTAPSPLLANMRLDVRVRSSSSTTVQTSLAQNLQFETDLRLRGTAAQPSVLGRITITEGELVFFGSQYQVSSGTISFYNPVRIEPVLNITLETQAKSVSVILNVTGPIDNMKLSYTSDPPLQFQEIVALLAAGKTPTSDPTLLANQPSTPQQSFEQMGESAIVSKAIADPVASRLQRVFGVSQLKIDPTFTNGSDLPQARVTLQQQIATNLTFTYVTALDDPNTQIVRVEWSFNPRWSAAATRDENGIVSINFLYKRQFR